MTTTTPPADPGKIAMTRTHPDRLIGANVVGTIADGELVDVGAKNVYVPGDKITLFTSGWTRVEHWETPDASPTVTWHEPSVERDEGWDDPSDTVVLVSPGQPGWSNPNNCAAHAAAHLERVEVWKAGQWSITNMVAAAPPDQAGLLDAAVYAADATIAQAHATAAQAWATLLAANF